MLDQDIPFGENDNKSDEPEVHLWDWRQNILALGEYGRQRTSLKSPFYSITGAYGSGVFWNVIALWWHPFSQRESFSIFWNQISKIGTQFYLQNHEAYFYF